MAKKLKVALVHVSDPALYGNPLALGCLKTYADSVLRGSVDIILQECGIDQSLKDPRAGAAAILRGRPAIVGFSCYIWNVMAVMALCRALKKLSPGTRIVLGGADATARGAAVLGESKADVLVRGEGELTFAELLSRFLAGKPWAGTTGTVSLVNGQPVEGPAQQLIKDLDIIPSPYLAGLFDSKNYHYLVHETSRGCPFNCKYCVWSNRGGVRNFSLERVRGEISWLTSRAPLNVGQQDDTNIFRVFVSDQDLMLQAPRARKILRHIRAGADGRFMRYIIHSDLKHWDERTAAAGDDDKFLFCFGIQSVDRRVLKQAGRAALPQAGMRKCLDLLKTHAPKTNVVFQLMLGLPGDSPEGFMKSLRWCLKACDRVRVRGVKQPLRARVQVFHTAVFPNTQLEMDAAKFGMEWDRNPPYLIKRLDGFEEKDFERCYKELRDPKYLVNGIVGNSEIMIGVHGRLI